MLTSQSFVYIMTDEQHSLLYTGRTGNLRQRVAAPSGNGSVSPSKKSKTGLFETVEDTAAAARENSDEEKAPGSD
jgi:predicted GIY-YIG superfamily endonuclease